MFSGSDILSVATTQGEILLSCRLVIESFIEHMMIYSPKVYLCFLSCELPQWRSSHQHQCSFHYILYFCHWWIDLTRRLLYKNGSFKNIVKHFWHFQVKLGSQISVHFQITVFKKKKVSNIKRFLPLWFCMSVECGDDGSWSDVRELLGQLPDVHYSLLRYMCRFLALVERHHDDNRMTALNLATVFGPNVFQWV